ncbi:hypothetical protein [Marinobacter shengliensis]
MKNKNSEQSVRLKLANRKKKGGKQSMENQNRKIVKFMRYCKRPPAQIGKKQVLKFFSDHDYSLRTEIDYYYAIKALWEVLERPCAPPKPPKMREARKAKINESQL